MTHKILAAPILAALALAGLASHAQADTVNATLSATYFEVKAGTGAPDFGGSGFPNVAAGSALAPTAGRWSTAPIQASRWSTRAPTRSSGGARA